VHYEWGKEKYEKGRQAKKSHPPKKHTHTDYKMTETEIFQPSAIQIIIAISNSGVQTHFSENLSYSNFESRE
jgi:hypothetical protein